MVRSSGNAAKGLWQAIEQRLASLLPRQAIVTRFEGGGVWVRFVGEDATAPESRFPSTVARLSAGSSGWVITIGGKKGLFVATGIRPAIPRSAGANQTVPATTSGDYPVSGAALTFTGLIPGSVVTVKGEVVHRVGGAVGNASFGFQVATNEITTLFSGGTIAASAGYTNFVYSVDRIVGSDGILTVVPAFRWSSGTVTVVGAYITASVH